LPKTKEKKATVNVGGGATATFGQFNFKAEYTSWKEKCSSLKRDTISPIAQKGKGEKYTGRKRSVNVPEDLYEQLKQHATASFVRPQSPNKGDDGFKFLLDEIEDALMKKEIYTADDLEELEKYEKEILSMLRANSTLNPRNITFKSPKKFKMVNGEMVVDKNAGKETYYGHYANEYFQQKYGISASKVEGWSSKSKNTATPPLYQAIAGGSLFPKGGLLNVIENAIDEIESKPFVLESISSLRTSRLPEVQTFIHKNYKKFMKDNNIQGFLNELNAQSFTPRSKKTITILEGIKELKMPVGDLQEYRLNIKTTSAMKSLIENVYRNNSRITKPEIKKAWFDLVKSEVILW